MNATTSIEWTDRTWNPVTGCDKVSPGCAHCYAEGVANRFWASQYPAVLRAVDWNGVIKGVDQKPREVYTPRQFTDVRTHEDRLLEPLSWRKPSRVFVNSMSDLFHEDVPAEFVARVFAVMALSPWHTYQILTKRPERMRALVNDDEFRAEVSVWITMMLEDEDRPKALQWDALDRRRDDARATAPDVEGDDWALPNVWLGVSVENQHFADERIPLLLQTPAAVRFISAEPLLERIDLTNFLWTIPGARLNRLHWIIVGGESGAGARPFDLEWARWLVAQGRSSDVPVFVKQLGAYPVATTPALGGVIGRTAYPLDELRNRKGGDPLEWPADLQVRQFPVVRI